MRYGDAKEMYTVPHGAKESADNAKVLEYSGDTKRIMIYSGLNRDMVLKTKE